MTRRPPRQRLSINWSAITSFITAATAVGALIFTAESLSATREQIEAAHDQVNVAQQGQFTERYSRAIEQLGQQGPTQLQIRLGGIYALERLARDSPPDQPTIIEVLTTFIRTNTPTPHPDDGCPTTEGLTPDVQAAITVLGRRDINHDNSTAISLQSTCLHNADLSRANLTNAILHDADLTNTELSHANLTNTDLTNTDLSHANLSGADLKGAIFNVAIFNAADLTKANLDGAISMGAILVGANLSRANLTNAVLHNADLTKADLRDADLRRANLSHANLSGADLSRADRDSSTYLEGVRTDEHTIGI